jgi:hypothetical protein
VSVTVPPPTQTRDPQAAQPLPPRRPPVVTRAEAVACTCPEACERDHEHD